MPANPEQQHALDAWEAGRNIILQAAPGTGKTWTLLQAAVQTLRSSQTASVLYVAYNAELAAATAAHVASLDLGTRITCSTFHALCCQRVATATDDASLERCLLDARHGRIAVHDLNHVTHVLVDEAQDLNRLHVDLLSLLMPLHSASRQFFITGDTDQMLYDYGVFASSSRYMVEACRHFASGIEWYYHTLRTSHRITPRMARLVDAHFDTGIQSAHELHRDGASVQVHGSSAWDLGSCIQHIMSLHADVPVERMCLLTPVRRNNVPLRAALNALSAAGVPLFVHGIDRPNDDVRRGKLRVSTWHSAKGTECAVAIVLVPAACKRNPLYVALTRARRYLHMVVVRDEVDPALCRTFARLCDDVYETVLCHASARPIVAKGSHMPEDAAQLQRKVRAAAHARPARSLDGASLSGAIHRFTTTGTPERALAPLDYDDDYAGDRHDSTVRMAEGLTEFTGDTYVGAVLCSLEFAARGRVRAMEDCMSPARLPGDAQSRAVYRGHQGRFVSPGVSDSSLLTGDLRGHAMRAYQTHASADDWCTVSLAIASWNAYHYRMRQLLPVSRWVDADVFDRACTVARAACASDELVQFDVRLSAVVSADAVDDTLVHVRTHASGRNAAYHFVWSDPGSSDRDAAALRAALHPTRTCCLVSLATAATVSVRAEVGLLASVVRDLAPKVGSTE